MYLLNKDVFLSLFLPKGLAMSQSVRLPAATTTALMFSVLPSLEDRLMWHEGMLNLWRLCALLANTFLYPILLLNSGFTLFLLEPKRYRRHIVIQLQGHVHHWFSQICAYSRKSATSWRMRLEGNISLGGLAFRWLESHRL